MKKKLIALTLVSVLLLAQTASAAIMYALDGRTLWVPDNEIEAYRQVNWYYGKPVTMYALDGRTLTVGENDVEMYRQVGWYYGKPVTMYALDGRTLTIGENDIAMYEAVGWYRNKPGVTMYALDGRTITVGNHEIEAYRQVGWYYGRPTTMYSLDGRKQIVGENDIAANSRVGWYTPSAMRQYFYNRASDVASYTDRGYENARNQYEYNNVAYYSYAKWDTLLNDIYKFLKKTMNKSDFSALEADEYQWIIRKEASMNAAAAEWKGGTGEPLVYYGEGALQTKDRCYYLISLIQ